MSLPREDYGRDVTLTLDEAPRGLDGIEEGYFVLRLEIKLTVGKIQLLPG